MAKNDDSMKKRLQEALESIKKEAADRERQIGEALMSLNKSRATEAVSKAVKKTKGKELSKPERTVLKQDVLKTLDAVLKEMNEMEKIRKKIRGIENKMLKLYGE